MVIRPLIVQRRSGDLGLLVIGKYLGCVVREFVAPKIVVAQGIKPRYRNVGMRKREEAVLCVSTSVHPQPQST